MVTWQRLLEFKQAAEFYLNAMTNCVNSKCNTRIRQDANFCSKCGAAQPKGSRKQLHKFKYAVEKILKRVSKKKEDFDESVEDIRADTFAADENKLLLTDETGRYRDTAEGLKRRRVEVKKLLDKEIEVEPFFAQVLPEDLTEEEIDYFENFVISPEDAAKLRVKLEPEEELEEESITEIIELKPEVEKRTIEI